LLEFITADEARGLKVSTCLPELSTLGASSIFREIHRLSLSLSPFFYLLAHVSSFFNDLEPLAFTNLVVIVDLLPLPLPYSKFFYELVWILGFSLYPLRDLPVLQQSVINGVWVEQFLFAVIGNDFLNFFIPALFDIPFIIHLLEHFVLFLISSNKSVDLFIIRDLIFFFLVLLFVVLFDKVLESLLSFDVRGFLIEHTRLNNLSIQVLFHCCFAQDALFYFRGCDQSVHSDFVLLANSMSSILGLLVHLGVPVTVKDYYGISDLKVKSMPSCSCTQQEHLKLIALFHENLQVLASILVLGTSVESKVLDTSVVKKYLHDIHQLSKLRKDQNLVTCLDQLWENAVHQLKLATTSKDFVSVVLRVKLVHKQVGMVTNFPELHHGVS